MNGNWWIGDVDQNIKAEGVDGVSPTIGMNGKLVFRYNRYRVLRHKGLTVIHRKKE